MSHNERNNSNLRGRERLHRYHSSIINLSNKEYKKNNIEYFSQIPIQMPTEGIKYENIFNKEDPILKDLECPICLNLIWDPIECNDCGKTFCKICLEKTKETKDSCPTCRKNPFQGRISKSLRTFFNKIKINCIFKGCKEHPYYSEYIDHIKKCKFRLYQCNNEGCNYQDILEKMEIHSTECKFLKIKCQYCSKEVNMHQIDSHEKTECNQIIFCPKCHLKLKKNYYNNNHRKNDIDSEECLKEQIKLHQKENKELLNKIESLNGQFNNVKNEYNSIINKVKKNLQKEKEKNENLTKELERMKYNIKQKDKWLNCHYSIYLFVLLISCFYYFFQKYHLKEF